MCYPNVDWYVWWIDITIWNNQNGIQLYHGNWISWMLWCDSI